MSAGGAGRFCGSHNPRAGITVDEQQIPFADEAAKDGRERPMLGSHRHRPLNAEKRGQLLFEGIDDAGGGLCQFTSGHAAAEAVDRLLGCRHHIRMPGQAQIVGARQVDRRSCPLRVPRAAARRGPPLGVEPVHQMPLDAMHQVIPAVNALEPVGAKPHLVAALDAVHHIVEGNGVDPPAGKGISQREPLPHRQAIDLSLHKLLDRLVGGCGRLVDAHGSSSGLTDASGLGGGSRAFDNA